MLRTRIKICGVTTPRDAIAAIDLGADAIGLNFYAKSPRYVTEDQAEAIIREVPPFAARVGIFVDQTDATIFAFARRFGLTAVQTYSTEPPDLPFHPIGHVSAFRIREADDLAHVQHFIQEARTTGRVPQAVLLDSYVAGEMGGTGHIAPWDILAKVVIGLPVILAGGLTPDNIAEAIRVVRPWGVDVASGVEVKPGRKDLGKMRAFVQAVRSADRAGSEESC